MFWTSPKWFGEGGGSMRAQVRKKTPEQKAARKFRARRKHTAKRTARQTGLPVAWKDNRLVFVNSGKPVDAEAA